MPQRLPARIERGLAVAAALRGVRLTEAPTFVGGADRAWHVPVELEIGASSEHVPSRTCWVVMVASAYPYGPIAFYPAAKNGLTVTFPHQQPNAPHDATRRQGKLCLDDPYKLRSIARATHDPVGDADERLRWYVGRALDWLRLAATHELVPDDDPFEIPRYPTRAHGIRLVHDESPATFSLWEGRDRQAGQVMLSRLPSIERTYLAVSFKDPAGEVIRVAGVPLAEDNQVVRTTGVWWFWPEPIVVPPWGPVVTWQDLREAGRQQRIDVDQTLSFAAAKVRGRTPLLLLLGFAIPRTWGGPDIEIHWQALDIGMLEKGKPQNGQRANERGWWQRDRVTTFGPKALLPFADTENWHPDRLLARGRLAAPATSSKVAIIGCGSLGSIFAQLLVRAGTRQMVLFDGQLLETRNLVRHALTVREVGQGKAAGLAAMLRAAAPLARIDSCDGPLPTDRERLREQLDDCDVIVDCTAADDVPAILAEVRWSHPRTFLSISTGFRARRAFIYRSRGHSFPAVDFNKQLAPWLEAERAVSRASGELREGAGCYSPYVPARIDDVTLIAIAAVKALEQTLLAATVFDELLVLEPGGEFGGLVRATIPGADEAAAV